MKRGHNRTYTAHRLIRYSRLRHLKTRRTESLIPGRGISNHLLNASTTQQDRSPTIVL